MGDTWRCTGGGVFLIPDPSLPTPGSSFQSSADLAKTVQQRLQHVLAASPAVLFTLAIAGDQIEGFSWISDNLREILGHPPEAALSPDWWRANIHPDDRDKIIAET